MTTRSSPVTRWAALPAKRRERVMGELITEADYFDGLLAMDVREEDAPHCRERVTEYRLAAAVLKAAAKPRRRAGSLARSRGR